MLGWNLERSIPSSLTFYVGRCGSPRGKTQSQATIGRAEQFVVSILIWIYTQQALVCQICLACQARCLARPNLRHQGLQSDETTSPPTPFYTQATPLSASTSPAHETAPFPCRRYRLRRATTSKIHRARVAWTPMSSKPSWPTRVC